MQHKPAIQTVPEFYARALAIEREAAERYGEFAEWLEELGNDEVAWLFRQFAFTEAEHAHELEHRAAACGNTHEDGEYAWLESGAHDPDLHQQIFALMTPYDAIQIALNAERRAQAFFEAVAASASDPQLARLAADLAEEEGQHIRDLEAAAPHSLRRPHTFDESLIGSIPG